MPLADRTIERCLGMGRGHPRCSCGLRTLTSLAKLLTNTPIVSCFRIPRSHLAGSFLSSELFPAAQRRTLLCTHTLPLAAAAPPPTSCFQPQPRVVHFNYPHLRKNAEGERICSGQQPIETPAHPSCLQLQPERCLLMTEGGCSYQLLNCGYLQVTGPG